MPAGQRNPFAWSGLDRASERRRDDDWIEARRMAPESRWIAVWRGRSLIRRGPAPRAVLLEVGGLTAEERRAGIFLGLEEERALFAVDLSHAEEPLARLHLEPEDELADLRQVGGLLADRDGALLAYARAIVGWHREHRFCGRCGAATAAVAGGHVRRCSSPDCGRESFPRTDPAVIMLVTDGERALLGRQPSWPPAFYSTLAGFCEPGESLEDAVVREVAEEAGVRVVEARYHSSQPWPFPSSLMLGFVARALPDEPRIDRQELEDARWLTREELQELRGRREIRLPPRISVARRLIEGWLAGESP